LKANFYQLSPRDLNRYIRVHVSPFEEGFDGEAIVTYGPISIDENVQKKLGDCILRGLIDINCEGTSSRSTFPFDNLKADCREVQLYDKRYDKLVDSAKINKELVVEPSMVESLQLKISNSRNSRIRLPQLLTSRLPLTRTETC